MKRTIEILRRLVVALAALTAPSAAEAAVKTLDTTNALLAFWPQFSEETLTSGSYTFSNFRSTTLNNGIVTVDSTSGFAFSNSTDTATWSGNGTGITIMLNYSDYTKPSSGNKVFVTTFLNGVSDSAVGLYTGTDGYSKGFWCQDSNATHRNGTAWSPGSGTYSSTEMPTAGTLFFEYDYVQANKGGTGVYVYNVAADATSSEVYHATGLRSNVAVGKICHIGSSFHDNATLYRNEGLKVHSVAIFQKTLTAAERTAFALTRKLEVSADTDFANLTTTSFTDLYGNATDWNAGTNLCINVPSAASDTVTLTLPSEGLNSGSLLYIQVAEGKTLVLSGSATAGSIVVTGKGMVSCSAANALRGTIKGDGTIKYVGCVPTTTGTDAIFTNAVWTGTVWLKNVTGTAYYSGAGGNRVSNNLATLAYGNSGSKLKLTGVQGYCDNAVATVGTIVLEDGDGTVIYAWENDNGSTGNKTTGGTTIAKLEGSGTFYDSFDTCYPCVKFTNIDNFSGSISTRGKRILLGDATSVANVGDGSRGSIAVGANVTAAIAQGKKWSSGGVFTINGTITNNGTIETTGMSSGYARINNDSSSYDVAPDLVVAGSLSNAGTISLSAPATIRVTGNLALTGSNGVASPVDVSGTFDLSAWTGTVPAVSGAITVASGAVLKLPAGAALPYQIAGSGDAIVDNVTYQIGDGEPTTGAISIVNGAISAAKSATLTTAGEAKFSEIAWTGIGTAHLLNVNADTRLYFDDISGVGSLKIVLGDGAKLYVKGEAPANCEITGLEQLVVPGETTTTTGEGDETVTTTTPATPVVFPVYAGYDRLYAQIGTTTTGNGAISATGAITVSSDTALTAGNYTLARWITPQKLSTGYGYAAAVSATVASGCAYELVYMADRIVLRVYDTAAQSARGTLKIWPYGDSITEGFNSSDTTANYRVLLAQKLSLLGYNVEMVGCYDKVQSQSGTTTFYDAKDPSGQTVPDEWKWHSGKHGAPVMPGISGLPGRGALLENVDTLCAQVGNPDVVLLHIGVNDLSQSSDTAGIFAAWTNTVWRILNNLPDTKVVVSTVMYRNAAASDSLNTKITALNGYINTQMSSAAELPFPSGRVLLADLNSAMPSTTSGYLCSSDNLHPDWWGHDVMAEGWLEKVLEFYPSNTATYPSAPAIVAPASAELGAAAKTELADYRKGFTRYGVIDVSNGLDPENFTYSSVNSDAAASDITKVGYFVEYVRADNNVSHWVWVDMDAFGSTIADVGLPSANHQQVVNNLHVCSSHGGIDNVAADDDTVQGFVEFSPYGYSGAVSSVSGAPTGWVSAYDWNDTLEESGAYGTMQVHRKSPPSGRGGQVLFAFNNWNQSSTEAEFGIGNFAQHFYGGGTQSIDYKETAAMTKMNAAAYSVKTIEIWTKGASEYITNDKKGSSQNYATFAEGMETWTITMPGSSGSVRLDSIILGLRKDSDTERNKLSTVRLAVTSAQGTVAVSELMNGTGTPDAAYSFANGSDGQRFVFNEDCVLECGMTYSFQMLNSSGTGGAWPARLEASDTASAYSPIVNTKVVTAWRLTQTLNATRVHTATVSADVASFGALTFSPSLPTDAIDAALLVNVTANATVTLGDAMPAVGSIRFAVAEGATLTIADPANISAGEVVFYGPGTVAFGSAPNFGAADVEFAGSPMVALALGQTIATTGDVVIDKNAAVTFEPATITDPTAALVSAASLSNNGTIAVTAPDQGSDYSVAATATGVTLRRVTREAFSYNAYPNGGNPTGWFTSWGGETFSTVNFRVGPSSAIPYVYYVDGATSKHPYYGLPARSSAFSFSIYADVSQMTSDKGIIAEFGTVANGLVLYRQGDYIKVARLKNSNIDTPAWVPGIGVQAGYHLWTVTFNPATGAAALYLDDGTISSATDGSTHSHFGTGALAAGFQVGSFYQGVGSSGFTQGTGLAVCSMRGYNVALTATEIATLAESFPATNGNVSWNVAPAPDAFGNTYIVTSTTIDDSHYLGVSVATMTIPSGSTVSTKHLRVLNSGYSNDAATLNIAGELDVTSVSENPNVWQDCQSNGATRGVMFGHWTGTGTYNITGALRGPDAYLQTVYTAGAQTININGGTVSVKGLYASKDNSTINLYNNGVLEVKEILSTGSAITKNFRWGTFRILADATETRAINFSAASGNATTLDPYGHTLTLGNAALIGAGDITVADSSDGAAGKVVFPAGSGYTGRLILTDDNAANMDISAYTGKIVLRGTAAATIAELNNFAGVVIINAAGTYDATAIDLSRATVQISHADAVLNATAGKEGNVVVFLGACNLYADNTTFLYDGHIFTGGVNDTGATLAYYHGEAGSAGSLAWDSGAAFTAAELAEVKSGNNIAPYFKIFTGHADGDDMVGSLAVATDWNGHTAEDTAPTSGNMAIRVADGKTLTVEVPSAVTFGEVQVFGSGAVVFTGAAALTVTKGLYVTPGTTVSLNGTNVAFTGDGNPGVHVDYGLTAATSGTVVLADGTAETPYAPYIYGQGAVVVSEGAVASLANQQNAISYLTVDGRATARASASTLSTLTVSATGVLDVPAGATVAPATLTVNGTMNMASTATLSSVTTLSGTGTVVWNGKNPDQAAGNGIWTSSTWSGTNYVKNITAEAERLVHYWGRNGSYVKLENVKGRLAHNAVINAEVVLANGDGLHGLEISNGSTQDAPTYFRKLSGSGTFKQTGTEGNQRYVLRDVSDFTGSIEKTDTVRVLIIDATTYQANLPAKTDNGGNMFVANITAKIGDGKSWSVGSGKSISIAGTATVELLGAASITGATTIGGGATLTFDDIGTSEAPKKLTLNSAVTVASANTVNIALSAEAAAALYDGAVLIDWTAAGAAPAGSFAFSDSALADSWVLFKAATGLVVYDKTIDDTNQTQAAVLDIDDSGALVAAVTPTGNAITLPAVISKMTLSVSASQLANITAPGVAVGDVVVKYGNTVTTGAYSITKSGDVISFDINTAEGASVTIADETIKVRPETAASTPMTMSAAGPSFAVKAIPGLWYQVVTGTSMSGTELAGTKEAGTAVQATTTTVSPVAPAFSGTVKYYKIAVGASKAALQ